MPVLPNARWERFAQELAKGTSQAKAYAAAGYKPSDAHASRLASNGQVAGRVAELRAAISDGIVAGMVAVSTRETVISVGTILDELEEARLMGKRKEQGAAMAAASIGKAKLLGLIMKPAEIEIEQRALYILRDQPPTAEQWLAEHGSLPADTEALEAIRRARAAGVDPVRAINRFLAKRELKAPQPAGNGHDPFPLPQPAAGAPVLAAVTDEPKPAPATGMPAVRPRRVLG